MNNEEQPINEADRVISQYETRAYENLNEIAQAILDYINNTPPDKPQKRAWILTKNQARMFGVRDENQKPYYDKPKGVADGGELSDWMEDMLPDGRTMSDKAPSLDDLKQALADEERHIRDLLKVIPPEAHNLMLGTKGKSVLKPFRLTDHEWFDEKF